MNLGLTGLYHYIKIRIKDYNTDLKHKKINEIELGSCSHVTVCLLTL